MTKLIPTFDSDTQSFPPAVITSLDKLYIGSRAPGRATNRFVFLGDSLTQGADIATDDYHGQAFPIIASVRSGGRIVHARNAGISGNTTSAMLTRFDTDVTPHTPTVVSLLAGTNDSAVTTLSTWISQMTQIIVKIRAIGAVPIMATIPPNNTGAARKQAITQQNVWIREFANRNGISLVDFYALLADPVTGNYKSVYNNDGTHPNAAGSAAMGALYADTIAPTLSTFAPSIVNDDADQYNINSNGCFASATGTSLPSGWVDNAGTPSGSALSYVTDSAVPGKLLTVTSTATTGIRQIARTIVTGTTTVSANATAGDTTINIPVAPGYQPTLFIGSGSTYEVVKVASNFGSGGQTLVSPLQFSHNSGETVIINATDNDVLAFGGRVNSDSGVTATTSLVSSGGTTKGLTPLGTVTGSFTRGAWYMRHTVPAGTNQIVIGLQNGAGTGVVAWGQVTVYNLTRMGIA